MSIELWTIVFCDTGDPVPPFDCNPEHHDEGMLVYRSREAAEAAAVHQAKSYDGLEDIYAKRIGSAEPVALPPIDDA